MSKRMADGLQLALEQALQMKKNVTQENWVEVYQESIEELKPNIPDDEVGCEIGTGKGKLAKYLNAAVPPDYYSPKELHAMGIECDAGSMVHRQNIIVGKNLKIGKNTRIDGYCTISTGAGITIGDNVHIAGYVSLFGGAGIEVGNNASIASGAKVYSVSDDVSGRGLVGPCAPLNKRHLHKGKVILGEHSVMAINSTIMPNSTLTKGSTLLPNSILVGCPNEIEYCIYSGVPAKFYKPKHDNLRKLVEE